MERRIDPYQHAQLVTTVVEVLRMGHHGRTQGVRPEGADMAEVSLIVGRDECAARDGVVVVERYAVYRDAAAVDRKAARPGLATMLRKPVRTATLSVTVASPMLTDTR